MNGNGGAIFLLACTRETDTWEEVVRTMRELNLSFVCTQMPHTPAAAVGQMKAAFEPVNLREAGEKGRKLAMSQLKIGRSPVLLTLKGTLSTDGITLLQSEEYGDKHSFGIRLETSEDVEAIETLLNGLDQVDPETDWTEWVTRPLFKNEILYLKAKLDKSGKKFNFTSNEKLAPKKPNPSTVMRDMPIVVTAAASAYFGTEDLTRGLTFDVKHVEFLPETVANEDMDVSDEESDGPITQEVTTPTPAPATNRRASLQPPPKPAKSQVRVGDRFWDDSLGWMVRGGVMHWDMNEEWHCDTRDLD